MRSARAQTEPFRWKGAASEKKCSDDRANRRGKVAFVGLLHGAEGSSASTFCIRWSESGRGEVGERGEAEPRAEKDGCFGLERRVDGARRAGRKRCEMRRRSG